MAGTGAGPTGPQRDEPTEARREVARMVRTIAHDVAHLEQRTIDRLLPALLEARAELERGLAEWLQRKDGADRYTAQEHRRGLVAVQAAIDAIADAGGAMRGELEHATGAGATLAAGHLREELASFGPLFGQSIRPTQVSTAAILADARHEIIPRIRTSAARYVVDVREDMQRQLAIGLARGETFTQLTNRLVRLGGPRGLVSLSGVAGEPGAKVEHIAEGLFARYRGWAERIVRTEVINAYNVEHAAAIDLVNRDADGKDDELWSRWDASMDSRVCAECRWLDGQVEPPGKAFPEGYTQPPAHPNCRCVLTAWHPSWGNLPGEAQPTIGAGDQPPPRERDVTDSEQAAARREEALAFREVDAERRPPMATSLPDNMVDKYGLAAPGSPDRQRLEAGLRAAGIKANLDEFAHGFAVPADLEARLVEMRAQGVKWMVYERATGKLAGELERGFDTMQRNGKRVPVIDHSVMKFKPEFRKRGISDAINGNALRRYEKWGVKVARVFAVDGGRYAWARLGFHFDQPGEILAAFKKYVLTNPKLAPHRAELVRDAVRLVREPWKLARWQAHGVRIGKEFLLSGSVPFWEGHMDIDRKNKGYRNAVRRAAVRRKP